MTTLLAVYNSEGCQGRCDARCYDAIHEECACCCGGLNHAVGQVKAQNNTIDMLDSMINFCKQTYGERVDILSNVIARQMELPLCTPPTN